MNRSSLVRTLLTLVVLLTACTAPMPAPSSPMAADGGSEPAQQPAILAPLQNRGPAPELSNDTWLNSEPLRLSDLRGQVVMVEFWTYGCINCRHVIPSVREWYETYHGQGLEIIGVHTPEFAYEKDVDNVRQAVADLGVTWPVAIDNEWNTWRAYDNRYWPAMYLVDKAGVIRHVAIGEGNYAHTEAVIQALLAEGS